MLVKLIALEKNDRATIREIYVNPRHIISVSEISSHNEPLINEAKDLGLTEAIQFSRLTIQEGNVSRTITVVGRPWEINQKINKKQILRG